MNIVVAVYDDNVYTSIEDADKYGACKFYLMDDTELDAFKRGANSASSMLGEGVELAFIVFGGVGVDSAVGVPMPPAPPVAL